MPAIDRGLDSLSFLPDAVRDALRRRLRELGGLALIGLSILLALALTTWSVQDPSLSHATNKAVRNVLGFPGAIVADLLMQVLGVAAVALVLPVAIWGWRLATHRPLSRERMRLVFWILGVLLAAAFAASLPRSPSWPLPAGLGGVTGDWMLRLPAFLAGGTLAGLVRLTLAVTTGVAALACFAVAAGFGWHGQADEAEEERGRGRGYDRRGQGARLGLARLDRPRLPQLQGAPRAPAADVALAAACPRAGDARAIGTALRRERPRHLGAGHGSRGG